jgi:hypothetical protein
MRHIPEAELHAYLDQALSRSQCVEIESHLARCAACQGERDDIAALRDRTTALLSGLAPALHRPPAWSDLEARAAVHQARRRRHVRHGAWAASVAAAVAAGWLASDLARIPAGNAPAGEAAAAVAPAAGLRVADPSPVDLTASNPVPPAPAPDPVRRETAAQPEPFRRDTLDAPAVPAPAGMALRSADGGLADFPLEGVWRTVTWDRLRRDSSEWVPRVSGLPVTGIRVSQGNSGGLSVVSQKLAGGETIRTVAGPASDVRSLISNRRGQSASAQLQEDARMASRADGDRMLVIMGDVPADTLRAFLLRVK